MSSWKGQLYCLGLNVLNLVADNSTIVRQQGVLSTEYVMCYEYF